MGKVVLSVIIPCYNDGKYLIEAIESIKDYEGIKYEIIIINDGSTDKKTLKIFGDLKRAGCFVINQKHKGPSSARNNGVRKARGKYILFLDSDDKINSDLIKKGINILNKNKEIGVVYSDFKFFWEEDRIMKLPDFDYTLLLFANYISVSTIIRKKVFIDVNGFDENLDKLAWEDWVFWIDVYKKGWKFYHIPEILFYYRIRKKSRNKISEKKQIRKKLLNYVSKRYSEDIYGEYKKLFVKNRECINDLKNKESYIFGLNNKISGLNNKITGLNNEVNDIKGSLTWKIVQKFDWIIRPLLFDTGIIKNNKYLVIDNEEKHNFEIIDSVIKESDTLKIPFRNKKKILFINHEESRTGAPKILFDVAKYFKEYYNVKIVSLKKGSMHDEFIGEFKEINYPNYWHIPIFLKIREARKILLNEKPDLVYVNSVVSYIYAIEAKKLGIPVIFHIHELDEGFRMGMPNVDLSNFNKWADMFIAVSGKVNDYLIKNRGCDPAKIRLINEFVQQRKVVNDSELDLDVVLKDIDKKENEIVVIGIGYFDRRKGADFFINSFKILNKKYPWKYKFVWIGDGDKDFKKEEILGDNFKMLGEKANPFPYLKEADIFLLPSREDPFPLVALEAMALGKPVIAFKEGGGIPEAIKDCGIVVDDMSSNALVDAISKLSDNARLIEKLGKKAKSNQKKNYDSEFILPKINDLIVKLLQNEKDKVSIILPSYNYGWCITEAINSVLSQKYKNWELVIVDDGSEDNSVEIIESYIKKSPDKIKLYFHDGKINQGLAETYKLGLSKCSGELIAFIEADDIWKSDYLSSKIPIFDKYAEVGLVYNNVEMFGSNKLINLKKSYVEKYLDEFEIRNKPFIGVKYFLDRNNILSFSSFVIRREMIKNIEISNKYGAWFDWYLLAQLSLNGKFYFQPEKKTLWRIHEKSYDNLYCEKLGSDSLKKINIMREEIRSYYWKMLKNNKNIEVSILRELKSYFQK